ncbi:hypothetical protein, partial [Methylicorpusculum sp.]|uniref:hypothetical protein n=1 Tax=Methylicorpusculum sp. TaxID=2713644 RepID=UPI002ABC6D8F
GADERKDHLAQLQFRLDSCNKEYVKKMGQLQGEHNRHLCTLEQEFAVQLNDLQSRYAQEKQGWQDALAQAGSTLQVLRGKTEDLEAQRVQNDSRITQQERTLVSSVCQAIIDKKTNVHTVLQAVKLVGGDREILRTVEYVQDVPFLVDLILSEKFNAEDLSAVVSGNERVPKSFFRAVRYDLQSRVQGKTLQENALSEWLAALERLGKRNCFCC